MAKANENVIRMPQQHVREGRGEPGYKSTDEAKVEVYPTEKPATLRTTSTSTSSGGSRKSKAEWEAEARAAGVDVEEGDTIASLKEKIEKAGAS